ncbi:prokineticin-1 [Mustelus asterias]
MDVDNCCTGDSFTLSAPCCLVKHACDRDMQCGPGSCCAVSLWLRGLRMCTPQGQEGDKCHPFSRKVPFVGKRQHHICPCLPYLLCSRSWDSSFRCTSNFKNMNLH